MADRSFGVREINIVGSAGTPTISSPNNINLNGNNVAISTDLQVGRNVSVVGVITATSFSGDGANLTAVDATTLDGVDSTSFLRSDVADTKTSGNLTFSDDVKAIFGTGSDLEIYHFGGVGSYIEQVGDGTLTIRNSVDDGDVRIQSDTGSGGLTNYFLADGSTGEAILYHYGTQKLATKSTGATVTGVLNATNVGASSSVTAANFYGDGSGLTNLPGGGGGTQAGIDTVGTSFFNTLHATGTIDIGTSNAGVAVTHMTIDSADVSGTIRNRIQSGAGNTDAVLDIQTKEFLVTDPYAGKGSLISADASGTKLYQNDSVKLSTLGAGVTVTGTMYATAFSGDGSQLTGVPISGTEGSFTRVDSQQLVVSGLSTFQGNVYLGDGDVLYIGDGNDLQLYHNNLNSVIRDAGTGSLFLQSNDVRLTSVTNSDFARFTEGADVELYYNGDQKFNTTGYGVTVLGTTDTQQLNVSGIATVKDVMVSGGSSITIEDNGGTDGKLYFGNDAPFYMWHDGGAVRNFIRVNATKGDLYMETTDSNIIIRGINDGDVQLWGSGTKRIETTDAGAIITGVTTVTGNLTVASNLSIESDGTDSFIKETNGTGELTISTNQLKIENPSFETLARFNENADVKLYYDNAEKFATTGAGVNVSGIATATSFSGEGGVTRWTLGANGSSDYTFTGIGFTQTTNDPDLHLVRGQTYEFDNQSGGSHPFEIRTTGGQTYNHGVTNNGASSGIIKFQVPYNAPTSLVYICTSHGSMVGNIYIDDNTVGGSATQNFTGIVTATSFQGNSTTGDGSDRGFTTKYYITADGSSNYRFAGPGVLNTTNDPTLYFHRGFTYILENSTGSGHPFALRVSAGGAAYNPGGNFLTGSQNGTQILTVPFDAPSSIVYQCTLHSGMVGTINFVS